MHVYLLELQRKRESPICWLIAPMATTQRLSQVKDSNVELLLVSTYILSGVR